jgi:hypothetical protein
VVKTAEQRNAAVETGSVQVNSDSALGGFAIFHQVLTGQEAVVPMESRNAASYRLFFDNTGGLSLGVAVANVLPQQANIPVIIRDDTGAQIATGSIVLPGNGQTSFLLADPKWFPITASQRGTIEFDTPSGGQISVLGIRNAPPANTITSVPALANVGTGGGAFAFVAAANGWKTTIVLMNTGNSSAQAHLKFFGTSGNALSIPLVFPQAGGAAASASSVDRTLAAGATLLIESAGAFTDPLLTGSAQLTTDGNVSGFVIFRHLTNNQEAVVPIETRNAGAYFLAFDNTGGTATGVALSNASPLPANVGVVLRDDTGTQIGSDIISLAPNGSISFTLVINRYPATAGIRGTIEFDTPAGGAISALGIRTPLTGTLTTLPAIAK